jgi:hypothetical protein
MPGLRIYRAAAPFVSHVKIGPSAKLFFDMTLALAALTRRLG